MHTGACECNTAHYQFDGEALTCYTCHCTDCQTASGSAFGLSMIVNEKDLEVIKGQLTTTAIQSSASNVSKHCCKQCGTTLWLSSEKYPGIVALKPGTFNETDWFKPIAHLWTRSALSWVNLDPSIPHYETQPEYSELMALWENREKI